VRNLLASDGITSVPTVFFGKHADEARKADAIQSKPKSAETAAVEASNSNLGIEFFFSAENRLRPMGYREGLEEARRCSRLPIPPDVVQA
jgi:hypothetical protein